MITSANTFWTILTTYLPTGKWVNIIEIYQTIKTNIRGFTSDDLAAATATNNEPTWHRNVRNVLQSRKSKGEILHDGDANYKLPLFSSEDILWIKNVKRNQGEGWAYDNVSCDGLFLLNWPTSKKGSASTPKIGDIIVLFQKPNKIYGKKNYKVCFTHLVTPISNEVILDESYPKHKWCRQVKLIAMPTPIEAIPNPGHFNFFLPNRGLTNPIINLENNKGLTEAETQSEVWDLFQNFFCENIYNQIFKPQNPVGVFGELEGDKIIREHIRQELSRRNSSIVQIAKQEALRRGEGRILCECCDFDFLQEYGTLGTGFIECHHKVHVSTGQRITTLQDLALVCSNCHRMLHRKNEHGTYYSVDELKELIDKVQ